MLSACTTLTDDYDGRLCALLRLGCFRRIIIHHKSRRRTAISIHNSNIKRCVLSNRHRLMFSTKKYIFESRLQAQGIACVSINI